jgi:hypothetical protein
VTIGLVAMAALLAMLLALLAHTRKKVARVQ